MSAVWEGYRLRPRTLVGATILRIMPDGCDVPTARIALETTHALLHAGARAIVASSGGPLTDAFQSAGAEWLPFAVTAANPLKLRRSAQALERYAASERVDIVHAIGGGAARIARIAAAQTPMLLVTSLPDFPTRRSSILHFLDASLAHGDRVIASSAFVAKPWVERYRLTQDRIAIIPHSVDTGRFAPTSVTSDRIDAIRQAWTLLPTDRAVLVPGRLVPDNGQRTVLDSAIGLVKSGMRNAVFVLAGDHHPDPYFAKSLTAQAQARGVDRAIRIVAMPRDLPAALAAAHTVVVPALQPPVIGRIAAQAQAMGRPVIAADVGVLPEMMLVPPRMADELRTGWSVKAGDAASLGRALYCALTLDRMGYQALAARARRFAEFMFAPERVAAATRAVYTSLLARNA